MLPAHINSLEIKQPACRCNFHVSPTLLISSQCNGIRVCRGGIEMSVPVYLPPLNTTCADYLVSEITEQRQGCAADIAQQYAPPRTQLPLSYNAQRIPILLVCRSYHLAYSPMASLKTCVLFNRNKYYINLN